MPVAPQMAVSVCQVGLEDNKTKQDLEESNKSAFDSEDDKKPWDIPTDFTEARRIYRVEAAQCIVMILSFAMALGHLYIYPDLFNVQICEEHLVPEQEKAFFHHGWVAMVVIFLIEAITVFLKIWSTSHSPILATMVAKKYEGNIGVLFGEYIVVAATYIIMGYNMMPVFIELRTNRRVYGVRYMEWAVDACGLVWLDCACLFNRSFKEFRMAFVWSVVYILFGLWSALATKWTLYWIFLVGSWLAFIYVCYMLVDFLRRDPRPRDPFGQASIKAAILSFIIFWWVLYGVLFMVTFQAPDVVPQWLEQLLWTGMDVVMKLSHTVVLMTFRATQWDIDSVVGRQRAETQRYVAELERMQATTDRDRALLRERQMSEVISQGLCSPPHSQAQLQRNLSQASVSEPSLLKGSDRSDSCVSLEPEPSTKVRHGKNKMPTIYNTTSAAQKLKNKANWTATPGLQIEVPTMAGLSVEVGENVLTERHRKGMMSPEDFAEMQRLEQLGSISADMKMEFHWQMRERFFVLSGLHHMVYDPDRWTETLNLFAWKGRARASYPCWIVILEAFVVNLLVELAPETAAWLSLSGTTHSLIGGAIMFLVVFRTQYAFRKWWEGRSVFGKIVVLSRVLAQRICAYVNDDELCRDMVRYVIVAGVATRCHLRNKRVELQMVAGIMSDDELEELNKQPNMPVYATSIILETLAAAIRGKCLPIHMSLDNAVRALDESIGEAERLLTPMPFVYVAHLRSFLFLYLLALPFVLAVDLGRMMTVAVALAAYLLIGLENTAVELENPFGYDHNDLPLDLYCMEIQRDLLWILDRRLSRTTSGTAARVAAQRKDKNDEEEHAYGDGGDCGGCE